MELTDGTVNLEEVPVKSTIGYKEVAKGYVFGNKYEVKERLQRGTHFIFRCQCLGKPISDGRSTYSTAILKVLSKECDADANVLHELRLWNWIFTNRAHQHTQIQRLNRPLDSPGNDKRILVFRPLHSTFDQLKAEWGPFSMEAVLRFGMEMLAAVRELHSFGVVHQNVQPRHFGVPLTFDPSRMFSQVVLLDFSQSRPFFYYDVELPPLPKIRTTPHPHYSSVEVMDGGMTQRRDDLISWFYTMLSLRDKLNWEDIAIKETALIRTRKSDWHSKPVLLCAGFRGNALRRLCELHTIIDQLEPNERPAYERMFDLLERALRDFCPDGVHPVYTDYSVVHSYAKAVDPVRESITRGEETWESAQKAEAAVNNLGYRRQLTEYRHDATFIYDRAESRSSDAMRKALEFAEDRRKHSGTPLSEK